jgi:glycosyltransferase involved in cell wall biosynthesis
VPERPKRVLQVVGGMVRAGVETWLMQVMRLLDPRRVKMDFLVHTDRVCDYDAEIEGRGSRLLRCTEAPRSPRYGSRFLSLIGAFGPYDVIHSHVHHFSGYLLWLARRAGIPERIAHSHSDTSRRDREAGWLRSKYLQWAKERIRRNATRLVAASRAAGGALFGEQYASDYRFLVLHCGIELAPFRTVLDRDAIRAALGIAKHEFVVGHAGRFAAPKNHRFLLEIGAEIVRRRPATRLLLIGDGPARQEMESRARNLGIDSRTIFAGVRRDVPALLKAMDVFVFPSLWEGLPLTLLEAQAAGIPCIVSDVISEEVDVEGGQIIRLPLAAGAAVWAVQALQTPPLASGEEALNALEKSSFNIERSVEQLYALYGA